MRVFVKGNSDGNIGQTFTTGFRLYSIT